MIYVYNFINYDDPSETHYDSEVYVSGCIGKVSKFESNKDKYVMFGIKVFDEKTGEIDKKFKNIKISMLYWSDKQRENFYNELNKASSNDKICILNGNIMNSLLLFDGKIYDDFGEDVEWKMTEFLEENTNVDSNKIVNSFIFNNVAKFSINKIDNECWNRIYWGNVKILECTKTSNLGVIKKEIYNNPEINWNNKLLHIENKELENKIEKPKSRELER